MIDSLLLLLVFLQLVMNDPQNNSMEVRAVAGQCSQLLEDVLLTEARDELSKKYLQTQSPVLD